jgi:hypothetical protein
MKGFFKILHEVATVGMMGTIAAVLVLLVSARGTAAAEYSVVRHSIDLLVRWLLFPSLGLVLFTGLIDMAIHPPFHNAGWAWINALLGVSVLEGMHFAPATCMAADNTSDTDDGKPNLNDCGPVEYSGRLGKLSVDTDVKAVASAS